MKTVSEILTEAADLIERNGKAYGALVAESPGRPWCVSPMCALGAIGYANTGSPSDYLEDHANDAVQRLMASLGFDDHDVYNASGLVGQWSDGNTAATVVAQLRAISGEMNS